MVKKIAIYCVIALLLSIFAAGMVERKNAVIAPGFCASVYAHDGWIYSIDFDAPNQEARVFRVNESGKELSEIILRVQTLKTVFNYDNLCYDTTSGQVYYHAAEFITASGVLTSEKIYCCDFEKGTSAAVWNVPIDDGEARNDNYIKCYRVLGQTLEYLTDTEDGYAVYHLDADSTEIKLIREVTNLDSAELSQFGFDGKGRVCAFSCAAGVYYETEEGILNPVSGIEDVWAHYYSPIWRENEISWMDISAHKMLTYSTEDGSISAKPLPHTYYITVDDKETVYQIDQDMLTSLGEADDGYVIYAELPKESWAGTEGNERFRYGVGIFSNGRINVRSTLHISFEEELLLIAKRAAMFMGFALAAGLLLLFCLLFQKHLSFISLRLEMAFFAVLLLGPSIGIIMSSALGSAILALYDGNYQTMRYALQEEINAELDNLIDQDLYFTEETPYTPEFHDKLSEILQNVQITNPATNQSAFAPFFLFHIIKPDGELEILYNLGETEHVPTSYLYHNDYLQEEFHEVIEHGKPIVITQYDTTGTWNVQLSYYENKEHNIRGVLEIGIDNYLTNWRSFSAIIQGVVVALIAFSMMMLMILLYLGSALAPIKQLGIQVAKGSVDQPRNSHWSAEIKTIWERLYVLISSGVQQKEDLERNNREHYRFFSHSLVELLGKPELTEVGTGTRRQCSLQIVHAVFQKPDPGRLAALSQELSVMAKSKGGILLTMDMHHAVWVYEAHRGDPLGTAESILKAAKAAGITCGVGLGDGSCTLYVRGAEWSAEPAAAGAEADKASILAEQAALRGDLCLMTEAASALAGSRQTSEKMICEDILCYELITQQSVPAEARDEADTAAVSAAEDDETAAVPAGAGEQMT